ncbi:hypothetical protein C8Q79DRAFT_524077 [Trametes meyenii]|nr:hypothetical protein C8Q79DRAFT_524077 [Trametes meyenii]
MKFFLSQAAVVLSLFAAAQAQNVFIAAPAPQSTLSPGQQLVVDVARGPSREGSQDVAIAIGLLNCEVSQSCDDIETYPYSFGTLLYSGAYTPQANNNEFSQNFTVTIPEDFPVGNSELSVVHFYVLPSTDTISLVEVQHESVVIG